MCKREFSLLFINYNLCGWNVIFWERHYVFCRSCQQLFNNHSTVIIIEYLSTLTLQYSNSVINDQLIIITMVEVECTATIPYYSAASLSNFCKKKKTFHFLTTEPCRDSLYHRPSDGLPIVFAFHLELPSLLDNHQVDDFLLPFVPNFVLNFPFSSNTCTR